VPDDASAVDQFQANWESLTIGQLLRECDWCSAGEKRIRESIVVVVLDCKFAVSH
jgi:hypothetical protein